MLSPKSPCKTAPTENPSQFDLANVRHAVFQAEQGLREQGVPIGAALVRKDGVVIGVGRNRRVQKNSAILHGEVRLVSPLLSQARWWTELTLCYADRLLEQHRSPAGVRLQGLHVSQSAPRLESDSTNRC